MNNNNVGDLLANSTAEAKQLLKHLSYIRIGSDVSNYFSKTDNPTIIQLREVVWSECQVCGGKKVGRIGNSLCFNSTFVTFPVCYPCLR